MSKKKDSYEIRNRREIGEWKTYPLPILNTPSPPCSQHLILHEKLWSKSDLHDCIFHTLH